MSAIATRDIDRNGLVKVAGGGLLTGVLTPLLQPLVDRLAGSPGDVRIALLAAPFAVLVYIMVRRYSATRWPGAVAAALVTMIAFVCAVNAAVWIDGVTGVGKTVRNILSGLGGGFTGSAVMALGLIFGLQRKEQRDPRAWLPMLIIGTLAGALLALDLGLDLNLASVLFPVWQAGVAVGLVMALQRSRTI